MQPRTVCSGTPAHAFNDLTHVLYSTTNISRWSRQRRHHPATAWLRGSLPNGRNLDQPRSSDPMRKGACLAPRATPKGMAKYNQIPQAGSPASEELETDPNPQHVETAYSFAIQALFFAFDHMRALRRGLVEPWLTYSPWTCARGALESCSVANWLLDATVGHRERVSRCLNLRLQDLRSQMTFFRSEPEPPPDAIPSLEGRVAHLRTEARNYSIPEKRNRRSELLGFDAGMPSTTQLIARLFAESGPSTLGYPLLSAAAHGVNWAVGTLGSTTIVDEAGPRREPQLLPTSALWLTIGAVQWLSRPSWSYFVQYGWDLEEAARILEDAYDVAGIRAGERFWRQP